MCFSNRLTAKECLQQPWFTREAVDLKALSILSSEDKPTKPRTPVPSKRPIPACEESAEQQDTEQVCSSTKPPLEDSSRIGLSAERRKSFKKNMECLVEHLEEEKPSDIDTTKSTCSVRDKPREIRLTKVDSFRGMSRANGMQTMPVSGFLRYNRNSCSLTTTDHTTYSHNRELDTESVFKFRRVIIINETEDHSPPPSINGSLSSDNSSISDSNSDTVSEMSIDSSSDRSSIISLDDSFDFPFGKSLSHSRHFSSCYNVWEASRSQRSPARLYPRECSGSFARALSKFAAQTENVKEGTFIRQRKKLTVFNGGNPSTSTPVNGKKCVGLEFMRERNGNIVVIREVKAINGSRYPRCSEVKCESLQSRMRKLDQNGLRTELSKEHHNIF